MDKQRTPDVKTYPDTLLNQIVLVASELALEAVQLGFVCLFRLVHPCLIPLCLRLIRGSDPNAFPGITISLDIFPPLCLGNGSIQGVDTERDGASADEKKPIETGSAWGVLATPGTAAAAAAAGTGCA